MNYHLTKIRRFAVNFARSFWTPFKIDVHVVEHCNLGCRGCSHFSPLAEPEYVDPDAYEEGLQHLAKFRKKIGAFQILGGEPLLHPELGRLIESTRKILGDVNINLLTNGLLLDKPDKLPKGFWEACRDNDILIKVTKYPIKADYDSIEAECRRRGVRYTVFADRGKGSRGNSWGFFPLYKNGFRHWSVKWSMLKFLRCDSFNCFQLVGNRLYPCTHVAYVRHLNRYFGEDFRVAHSDSVDLSKIKTTFPIRRLFYKATLFCRYCGTGYEPSRWEMTKKEREEWIREL